MPKVELGSFFDGADSWFSGFLDTKPQSVPAAPVIDNDYPSEFRHDCSMDDAEVVSFSAEEDSELAEDMKQILPDGIDKDIDFGLPLEIDQTDRVSQFLLSTASEITVSGSSPILPKKSVQFKVCFKFRV
jgi:hypothetical protein